MQDLTFPTRNIRVLLLALILLSRIGGKWLRKNVTLLESKDMDSPIYFWLKGQLQVDSRERTRVNLDNN